MWVLCTSFGLSLGKERLQGCIQAGGNLDLTELHYLQLLQKCCWKWCGGNFSPWRPGSVPPGVGWGWDLNPPPSPLNGTVQREGWIFILTAPRAARSSGQGDAFLWLRQMDEAIPSDIPAAASALQCDKSILGGARVSPVQRAQPWGRMGPGWVLLSHPTASRLPSPLLEPPSAMKMPPN